MSVKGRDRVRVRLLLVGMISAGGLYGIFCRLRRLEFGVLANGEGRCTCEGSFEPSSSPPSRPERGDRLPVILRMGLGEAGRLAASKGEPADCPLELL